MLIETRGQFAWINITMDKHAIEAHLRQCGVIAIVRARRGGDPLVRVVEAIAAGGVRAVEVTLNTPGALPAIEAATEKLAGVEVCIGAGSALDAESCRLAILAGAQYIVCPITSEAVIRMAHRYGKPCIPGALTPNEIFHAWELGGDLIKVFPSDQGGAAYIRAVRAPMPQIPLVPTGGVRVENMADFADAGATAVGVGGSLVSDALIESEDYAAITENARRYQAAWDEAKQ
jgi:2-dehydro-3-deoxyphosphogluconate aldolase/(4S)-4-hydroxy-2-oxoglutarate aldolase